MLKRPNILIIGAAGRNVGKTEFVCRLIERYQADHQVIGVKVTTVKERDGKCPRGGQGCGVCSSLKENYCITEETGGLEGKDTTRMLRAGAHKVYWMRVLDEFLEEGMADLVTRLPDSAVVVMESNSGRRVLEPGLFLVVREQGSDEVKPSCAAVIDQADRCFSFDGTQWDFQPAECVFIEGHWHALEPAAAIVLAGGKSVRMGRDKSLLPVDGVPMIQHIAQQLQMQFSSVLIGANDIDKYEFLGLPVIPDQEPGKGPLMGIVSCLEQSSQDLNFIVGCDIPYLDMHFVRHLLVLAQDADIVVPETDKGYEPLLAVYRKSVIRPARQVLAAGKRRVTAVFKHLRVKTVAMGECPWYRNLNTLSDYHQVTKESS